MTCTHACTVFTSTISFPDPFRCKNEHAACMQKGHCKHIATITVILSLKLDSFADAISAVNICLYIQIQAQQHMHGCNTVTCLT